VTEPLSVFERASIHDELDKLLDSQPERAASLFNLLAAFGNVGLGEIVAMCAGAVCGLIADGGREEVLRAATGVLLPWLPAETRTTLQEMGIRPAVLPDVICPHLDEGGTRSLGQEVQVLFSVLDTVLAGRTPGDVHDTVMRALAASAATAFAAEEMRRTDPDARRPKP